MLVRDHFLMEGRLFYMVLASSLHDNITCRNFPCKELHRLQQAVSKLRCHFFISSEPFFFQIQRFL